MSESDLNAAGAEKELGRLQSTLRIAAPLTEALREYTRGERDDSEVRHLIGEAHDGVRRALDSVTRASRVLAHRGHAAFREPRKGTEAPREDPPAELIDVAPEPDVRPQD